MNAKPGHVTVIGSLNVDYFATVPQLPKPGQTLQARAFHVRFGGKGANQAVAAARQGARVRLVGRVGADSEGAVYRRRLRLEGIDVRFVRAVRGRSTGRAWIALDERGENFIVVAPGANDALAPEDLSAAQWRGASIALLQMEVPVRTILAALRGLHQAGVPAILNAAPARPEFPWGKVPFDYLVVNEHEAAELFGCAPTASLRRWTAAIRPRLGSRGAGRVIVTRGALPTFCVDTAGARAIPTVRVRPVDTVGAGDAFAGALAAHLSRGLPLDQALALANRAGALATQAVGAQESMPTAR